MSDVPQDAVEEVEGETDLEQGGPHRVDVGDDLGESLGVDSNQVGDLPDTVLLSGARRKLE